MNNCDNIEIKVENEALQDDSDEDSNAQYEEYSFSTYGDYEQKEEKHIPMDDIESDEQETPHKESNENREAKSSKNSSQPKIKRQSKAAAITHLLEHGWSSKSYNELRKNMPEPDFSQISEFLTTSINEAQQYVHQECDSLCFANISEWLEVFKKMDVPKYSYYEPAIILNAIVTNEKLPTPEDLNGINMKAIYSFNSNALMGLPQKSLDPVSAKFLANEFEALIEEVNSEEADKQTILLKQKIQQSFPEIIKCLPTTLDPLWLTESNALHKEILPATVYLRESSKKRKRAITVLNKSKASGKVVKRLSKSRSIKKSQQQQKVVEDSNCKTEPEIDYNKETIGTENILLQLKNELNEL